MLSSSEKPDVADADRAVATGAAAEYGGALDITCVDRTDDLRALENAWRDLEHRCASNLTYFQSYDWCATWWASIGLPAEAARGVTLQVLTARRDGELIALWPLMIEKGPLGLRRLTQLGGDLSQYGGILIDAARARPGDIAACWQHLLAHTDADVIAIDQVPQASALASFLAGEHLATVADTASVVDLSEGGANSAMLGAAKASTRRNRKKRRKKLADGMELELVALAGGTPAYADAVDTIFRWKADWFRETGRPLKHLGRPEFKAFIKNLTDGAHALMLVRGGSPIAAEIGFRQGTRFYSYIGAFDWSVRDLSPGRVEIEEALHWLVGEDVQFYDLLGAVTAYKQAMSDLDSELTSFLHPVSVAGACYVHGWRKRGQPLLKRTFYGLSQGQRQFVTESASRLAAARRALFAKCMRTTTSEDRAGPARPAATEHANP